MGREPRPNELVGGEEIQNKKKVVISSSYGHEPSFKNMVLG